MTGEDRTTPRLVIRRQEFDRLRAIEAAARAYVMDEGDETDIDHLRGERFRALRAALEGDPMSDPTRNAQKPPVKWSTIRQDATERGLFSVVDEAMIGRKLTPTRRNLIVGNIVMAVAKWRQTFRDCGCWNTADGYALCQWHEEMLQSQVAPLRAALSTTPAPLDARRVIAFTILSLRQRNRLLVTPEDQRVAVEAILAEWEGAPHE